MLKYPIISDYRTLITCRIIHLFGATLKSTSKYELPKRKVNKTSVTSDTGV